MRRFEKAFSISFALCGPQVREPDTVRKLSNHDLQVVISADAEGPGTEGNSIGIARPLIEQPVEILRSADDPR